MRLNIELQNMITYYCFTPKLPSCGYPLPGRSPDGKDSLLIEHVQTPNSNFWKQYCLFLGGIPIESSRIPEQNQQGFKTYYEQAAKIVKLISELDEPMEPNDDDEPKECLEYDVVKCLIAFHMDNLLKARLIDAKASNLIELPLSINRKLVFPMYDDDSQSMYSALVSGAMIGDRMDIIYLLLSMYNTKSSIVDFEIIDCTIMQQIYHSARAYACYEIVAYYFDNDLIFSNDLIEYVQFAIMHQTAYDLAIKYFVGSSKYIKCQPYGNHYDFIYLYLNNNHLEEPQYLLKFIHQYILSHTQTDDNYIFLDWNAFKTARENQTSHFNLIDRLVWHSSYLEDPSPVHYQIFDHVFQNILPKNNIAGHDQDSQDVSAVPTELFEYFFYHPSNDTAMSTTTALNIIKYFSNYLPINKLDWNRYLETDIIYATLDHIRLYLSYGVTNVLPAIKVLNHTNDQISDVPDDYIYRLEALLEYAFQNNCHSHEAYLSYLRDDIDKIERLNSVNLLYFISRLIYYLDSDRRFDEIFLQILTRHSWDFACFGYDKDAVNECLNVIDTYYPDSMPYSTIRGKIHTALDEYEADHEND
jgi:hypothetical protein